jgi:hypothetical protein
MCWISNTLNMKVAEHDIKTYKILLKNTGYAQRWFDVQYKSPFMSETYVMGMMHMSDIKPIQMKDDSGYIIEKGIHSYSNDVTFKKHERYPGVNVFMLNGEKMPYLCENDCRRNMSHLIIYEPVVVECTIPKGASYYENEKGEIVSTQLVAEKEAESIMKSLK